jgi:T5SS/PEP-CTERM-associated repeat protein
MGISSNLQFMPPRSMTRRYLLILSVALTFFCARVINAAISTTGDVNPDPSTTTTSDTLYVGQSANGGMTVDGGSTVDSGGSFVGYDTGILGHVSISGAGSAWNAQSMGIGQSGAGELTIADGATLAVAQSSRLGKGAGSTGSAIVSGVGSLWNSVIFEIGSFGDGELAVTDGGTVQVSSVSLGRQLTSEGIATISGENSILSGQVVRVGELGRGALLIANGATVVSSSLGEIGSGTLRGMTPADGSVTVAGAGSSWINDDTLGIGARGKGELTIIDGGLVTSKNGFIAVYGEPFDDDSEGTVTVTGAGSKWTVSNRLHISGSGGPVGGVGTLEIGPGGLVQTGFVTDLGPKGLLKLDGGTFVSSILSFHSASDGGFEWNSGTLHVGRFGRSLTNPAGILAPGESIGSTIIDGDYTQESAATLEIEIGGSNAGEFDVVVVNNLATLGGTLDVRLINFGGGVFSPAVGDTFEIITATGGIVNRFEHALLPTLGDDLVWNVNYGPNAVSLTVTLPGDFNGDFIIDAADYVVWRKNGGPPGEYETWRTNFGRTAGDGSAAPLGSHSQVPEPASFVTIVAGVLATVPLCRRHR